MSGPATAPENETLPLAGIRFVEIALGTSMVGAGMATCLPGRLLSDFGADVVRVQPRHGPGLDDGVAWDRVWNRGKQIIGIDEHDPSAADTVAGLAADSDVVLLAGPEPLIEQRGLHYAALAAANPRLVVARIRPSYNALGTVPDYELLVQARAGVPTQILGHRRGQPAFGDLTVANAGAALSATAGILACLYERESTGRGGFVETSLYDGLAAILPMIIGRVERDTPMTTLVWRNQGPAEALVYRCADGEYVQLWFGAKGAYESFLEHMGDPPSERGYNADLASGALVERGARWSERFATHDRDWWVDNLAGQRFRIEPVLRPGQALLDPHVREIGLSVPADDADLGPATMLGPVARVTPATAGPVRAGAPDARLLSDVRVLDMSAYLAGPVAPLVLAELGADVVKVEPVTGDVHRNVEHMFAAGQRGKRAIGLDLKSPAAAAVLDRLFRWADVVHHNSRVGLAEKLGYDEATVRAVNAEVVYSFASGFGTSGPRAMLPTNDQLMQALSGIEAAQGGDGASPTYLIWGAVDVTGGWIAACGILAGLFARRRRGGGQSVATSLLGAALTLKSGAFVVADRLVRGPLLDAEQTGYGAAYRIYQCADDKWIALAVPDQPTWERLRQIVGVDQLQTSLPPLRTEPGAPQPAEELLEKAFRGRLAPDWVDALRAGAVPVEPVPEPDRVAFAAGFLDDPVNRQLGRITSYEWAKVGRVEQPCFPPYLGPPPPPLPAGRVPELGEHTSEVIEMLGLRTGDLPGVG
jgi:crotonobetainyl-CoA:carnitine CoA-transferase CaiB-like acyl-CoA transferase